MVLPCNKKMHLLNTYTSKNCKLKPAHKGNGFYPGPPSAALVFRLQSIFLCIHKGAFKNVILKLQYNSVPLLFSCPPSWINEEEEVWQQPIAVGHMQDIVGGGRMQSCRASGSFSASASLIISLCSPVNLTSISDFFWLSPFPLCVPHHSTSQHSAFSSSCLLKPLFLLP